MTFISAALLDIPLMYQLPLFTDCSSSVARFYSFVSKQGAFPSVDYLSEEEPQAFPSFFSELASWRRLACSSAH